MAPPRLKRVVTDMTARFARDPAVSLVLQRIGSPAASGYSERSNEGEIQVVIKPEPL